MVNKRKNRKENLNYTVIMIILMFINMILFIASMVLTRIFYFFDSYLGFIFDVLTGPLILSFFLSVFFLLLMSNMDEKQIMDDDFNNKSLNPKKLIMLITYILFFIILITNQIIANNIIDDYSYYMNNEYVEIEGIIEYLDSYEIDNDIEPIITTIRIDGIDYDASSLNIGINQFQLDYGNYKENDIYVKIEYSTNTELINYLEIITY